MIGFKKGGDADLLSLCVCVCVCACACACVQFARRVVAVRW